MTTPTIEQQDFLNSLDSNETLAVVTSKGEKLDIKVHQLLDEDGDVSVEILDDLIMTANENDDWLPRVH